MAKNNLLYIFTIRVPKSRIRAIQMIPIRQPIPNLQYGFVELLYSFFFSFNGYFLEAKLEAVLDKL
jgi:hypothetical protein